METQHYWLILKRRWLPASLVAIAICTLSGISLLRQKAIYQAEGKIRFTRGDRTTILTGVGREMGQFDPLIEDNNPINTEMEAIRSVPLIQATIHQLNLKDPSGQTLQRRDFLRRLRLNSLKGTDILQVGYQDGSPEIAKAVTETLMSLYLENHLQENRAEAMAARTFIEQQLPDAESRVREAEAALRQFKEKYEVAALEEEERTLVIALEELRTNISETKSQLADANAQAIAFNSQLGMNAQDAIAIAGLSQSPGVQDVFEQLQAVEAQLAVERVRFFDENPIIQTLEARRTNLETLLNTRIQQTLDGQPMARDSRRESFAKGNLQIGTLRAELIGDFFRAEIRRTGLADRVETLATTELAYEDRLRRLPRLQQEQRELARKLEAAQSTYAMLLQKLHEARVAENQNVGNARILQSAFVLEKPVAPRKLSHLASGGIFALFCAIATAVALEALDKSIRTVKEARDLFDFTLLGVIPLHKNGKLGRSFGEPDWTTSEVIVRQFPNSPICEAYRLLQANLKFLGSDRPLKTIVITSAVANEGKSVVSANLAMAKAQTGQRVLLIDADMRHPRQHKIWDLLNNTGLSNVIVEQLDPKVAIKKAARNLDVLTAGVLPPNPTALLDSQRMAKLIELCSRSYDFTIIDTPSLKVAADVPILSKMSDGVLFVTRPGVIDAVSAAFAKERLEQLKPHILGQVVNGVMFENEPYSYYYYTQYSSLEETESKRILPNNNDWN